MSSSTLGLTIDPEFRDLLPALSQEKREGLESDIQTDGAFLDPICYWACDGKNLIVDGHNRYDIWLSLPDDTEIAPPTLRELSFGDRLDVTIWMRRHALNKRNLTKAEFTYQLGLLYNEMKKKVGAPTENKNHAGSAGNNDEDNVVTMTTLSSGSEQAESNSTRDAVAEEAGVSSSAVARADKFLAAINAIAAVNSKAASDIRSGSLKVSKKDVLALVKAGDIANALSNLRNGRKWNDSIEFDDAEKKAEAANDSVGNPIRPEFAEVFSHCRTFRSIIQQLGQIVSKVDELCKTSASTTLRFAEFKVSMNQAKVILKFAMPYSQLPPLSEAKDDVQRKRWEAVGYLIQEEHRQLTDKQKSCLTNTTK